MSVTPQVHEIGDGVRLLHVHTENTKTTCISLILLTPLYENTAENTVLASFLAHSSEKYPTLLEVNEQLEELYGAAFSSDVSKLGEGYRLRLSVTCINDRLTLGGEKSVQKRFVCFWICCLRRSVQTVHSMHINCKRKSAFAQKILKVN